MTDTYDEELDCILDEDGCPHNEEPMRRFHALQEAQGLGAQVWRDRARLRVNATLDEHMAAIVHAVATGLYDQAYKNGRDAAAHDLVRSFPPIRRPDGTWTTSSVEVTAAVRVVREGAQ